MTTDFVDLLRRIPGYAHQLAHVQPLPSRPARFAAPAAPLSEPLAQALAARGISRLYVHQAAALDAARSGEHLGIVTATASGKTLCYQLATLEAALADPASRALFLFPTKALAHDQLRALNGVLAELNERRSATENTEKLPSTPFSVISVSSVAHKIRAATLDGDTPRAERDRVRGQAQIILSNPDMLHRTLLPDHQRWARLL